MPSLEMPMLRHCRLALLFVVLNSGAAGAAGWPDLAVAPSAPSAEGKAALPAPGDRAVIVGIERYFAVPGVTGAEQNARDWFTWLTRTRGLPPANVALLRDSEGTVEKMRRYAEEAARDVAPKGTVWFIFIGHGAPSKDGRDGVLVGADAQQDPDSLYARSLPRAELLATLAAGKQAHTMVVLDACFSGRTGEGEPIAKGLQPLIAVKAQDKSASGSVTVLSAGKADQFAGPLPGADRPAFSYLVLGAMRGWGDRDGNGEVTASEAVAYADEALRSLVRGRSQTPELAGPGGVMAGGAKEAGPDLAELALGATAAGGSTAVGLPKTRGGKEKLTLTASVLCQRKKKSGGYEDIPACQGVPMKEDDRIKFILKVNRAAHLYVYSLNELGQFQALFPEVGLDNEISGGGRLSLPAGEVWFDLDDTRRVTDTFYLVATEQKLPELEAYRGVELPPRDDGTVSPVADRMKALLGRMITRGAKSQKGVTVRVGTVDVANVPIAASAETVSGIAFDIKRD